MRNREWVIEVVWGSIGQAECVAWELFAKTSPATSPSACRGQADVEVTITSRRVDTEERWGLW